jgi:mannose-1-phosphate guanylyltransferase
MSPRPILHAVVIAGGSGTRFWPLSRHARPKQLLDLSGEGPLLRATFKRVESVSPPHAWWMVVGASHADGCRQAAPEVGAAQVLVEPMGRNTAPAIALAAIHLERSDPEAIMAVLPADHHVRDRQAFCAALTGAAQVAARGPIVTLGIRPTHPETGYGYIQMGAADTRGGGAHKVQRFCEKPDLARAEAFLAQGGFVWNAGIFVMRPQTFLAELERQLPETHAAMRKLQDVIGRPDYPRRLEEVYGKIKSISIDYGVMEHAADVAVVPVECGWSDVGSWSALGAVVQPDAQGNVLRGRVAHIDTKNSVVYATDGHVVGIVGMDGVVVVHTPDATLVLPAARAQEVRDVLEHIGAQKWREFL